MYVQFYFWSRFTMRLNDNFNFPLAWISIMLCYHGVWLRSDCLVIAMFLVFFLQAKCTGRTQWWTRSHGQIWMGQRWRWLSQMVCTHLMVWLWIRWDVKSTGLMTATTASRCPTLMAPCDLFSSGKILTSRGLSPSTMMRGEEMLHMMLGIIWLSFCLKTRNINSKVFCVHSAQFMDMA